MQSLKALMIIGAYISLLTPASWGDVLHFRDGQVLRGSVERVTGDLVEFRRQGKFSFFRNHEVIQRLRLSNRHDVVETRDKKKYFGEVVYVDSFNLELRTAEGGINIARLNIRDVVLGAPVEETF